MHKKEIKRNLLGSLEVALFMPSIEKRFGADYEEALRSFYVPLFMFPFALLGLYLFFPVDSFDASENTLTMLYSLRYAGAIGMFLALVYFIAINIDRREHFIQFVIAYNWVAIPSTMLLLPVLILVYSGAYSAGDVLPFLVCTMIYSYAFTAFLAMRIFRLPWEMGMFFAFISLAINNGSFQLMDWVAQMI